MFLRILSFDLEVLPISGRFPTPDICPIILASMHFNYDVIVDDKKIRNIILVLTKDENENGKIEFGGSNDDRLVMYLSDEAVLIEKVFELMKSNDVIVGYNCCGFDLPYIIDRWKILGGESVILGNNEKKLYYKDHTSKGMKVIKIGNLTGKIIFDVLYLLRREDESNIFKKQYNLKNVTLKHVAKEILKIEKLEFSVEEMISYWENGWNKNETRKKFIDYCSRDSELALKFVTQFRLLDRFAMMSRRSGKPLQTVIDSLESGLLVENLMLKAYKVEDRVMPCRGTSIRNVENLSGAEVMTPKLGVSENLASADFSSLYPSIMITHNICYSTVIVDKEEASKLVLEGKAVEEADEKGHLYGTFIKKEVYVGIVPKILTGLLGERAALKKELKKQEKGSSAYILFDAQQQAVKILLNSFYGYSGDTGAKLYYWIVATAVTTNGRKVIKKTWHIITDEIGTVDFEGRRFRLVVSAGDTDSSYIQVTPIDNGEISRKEVVGCVNYVLEHVNSIIEKPMNLAFEHYVRRMIVVAKKHYAMLVVDDYGKSTIISKGIESVRRDWCDFATENVSNIVDLILMEKDLVVGVNKSVELIKTQGRKLKKGQIDVAKLILSNKLTKAITEYDNKEAHVLVAIQNKLRGRPSQIGDRVQFLICNNRKKLISEKAEDVEWALKNKIPIDYEYYLNNQLVPPAMRILGLLGVKKEVLITGMDERQANLSRWF